MWTVLTRGGRATPAPVQTSRRVRLSLAGSSFSSMTGLSCLNQKNAVRAALSAPETDFSLTCPVSLGWFSFTPTTATLRAGAAGPKEQGPLSEERGRAGPKNNGPQVEMSTGPLVGRARTRCPRRFSRQRTGARRRLNSGKRRDSGRFRQQ